MDIIAAIDIMDGKCVRLTQGDFARRTTYEASPLETANIFEGLGLRRLHLVDLDGARSGSPKNLSVLESIASKTDLSIDFGGGIKSTENVTAVFDAGSAFVTIGSMAVKEPTTFFEWMSHYGPERFLLGADVRDGRVSIDGWQTDTDIDLLPMLSEYYSRGVEQTFVTDIRQDGLLEGPAFGLYKNIRSSLPDMKLIASGGVTSMSDIAELEAIGCTGVIVGKAIYEGKIALQELADYVS
jgi:phosphoribosylformimino-5-aminoimidazole carboxamide ribotide isomerase